MSNCEDFSNMSEPSKELEKTYTPLDSCVGQWDTSDACGTNQDSLLNSYITETINIAGAPIDIYPLLGVKESGVGSLNNRVNFYSSTANPQHTVDKLGTTGFRPMISGKATENNAYIIAEFKPRIGYSPAQLDIGEVGSIEITQSDNPDEYANQVRVDFANNEYDYAIDEITPNSGVQLIDVSMGVNPKPGTLVLIATSNNTFMASFVSDHSSSYNLPDIHPDTLTYTPLLNFKVATDTGVVQSGTIVQVSLSLKWKRIGIYTLPQTQTPYVIGFHAKVAASAFKITPIIFNGSSSWLVKNVVFKDIVPTNINNIEDLVFMENRNRKYTKKAIPMKATYTINDSMLTLTKNGFGVDDVYSFTMSFADIVSKIGRPLVIGDIIDLIPERKYDQNLKVARKYLEVQQTGWASEGFSPAWTPLMMKFDARPAIPSQETRDIFGSLALQQYGGTDDEFKQRDKPMPATAIVQMEYLDATINRMIPEQGSNLLNTQGEVRIPATSDGRVKNRDMVENISALPNFVRTGLPPEGTPYSEGYELPAPTDSTDGQYFRLYYPPSVDLPPALYRFKGVKQSWLFEETDERTPYGVFSGITEQVLTPHKRKKK